ncbi:hypothetical protein NliqN6_2331 [Naganishia liquefaciens]|uniref:RNA helicase n=1 Tax=Naganishia liquefaciens TaxID=104408 RepID=A0A8H3YE08_9TREE|nr:hypothetical protein NliqN6_2331 [Naganishia liquefaciens]
MIEGMIEGAETMTIGGIPEIRAIKIVRRGTTTETAIVQKTGTDETGMIATAATQLPATSMPTAPPVAETDKQREKREKLEAWKKAQAAKKAALERAADLGIGPKAVTSSAASEQVASKVASGVKLPAPLPGKPAFSAFTANTMSRIGLPMKPSAAVLAKAGLAPTGSGNGIKLDDAEHSERKLQKLVLPPIAPLLVPGTIGEGAVEAPEVGDLDAVSDDEDEKPMQAADKMDADDEEDDPLDAFMKENVKQVKTIDSQDQARHGGSNKKSSGARENLADLDDELLSDGDDEEGNGPMTAEDILALAAKKAKKKDLPAAQHAKIAYEPFEKKFYHPSAETAAMDEEDVELMRMEMDGIKIRGANCPKPVRNWGAFGLPAGCYDVIKRLGYAAPTPIQAQAIPAIMSGRDIIGVAKTGSGKTIAFLLPMMRHIKDQRPLENGEGPMALIMTPTRELATQIWRESKPFLTALGMRAVCAYGGSPLSEQIGDMKKGAEVVVCTPGRMIDLLTANSGRVTNLRRVTYLVLDEADRMFDMGFEPQVMKIVNNIRPDRQTVLFSATFPAKMDALARKILIKPLEITVGGRSVVAKEIEQRVEVLNADDKFVRLLQILGEMGEQHKDEADDFRTLIFVERQEAADDLFRELMRKGYICSSLHGGKDQVDRDQTISDFKAGFVPVVIATSVAARGLDVKELKLVINYDCPNHMEDYVHRAGRTGRAGQKGTCVTFITPEQERFSVDLVRALKASEAKVPPELEKMSEDFLVKVRAGNAKVAGSGFGGKGLDKFESEREKVDRAQRSAYGEDGQIVEKPEAKKEAAEEADFKFKDFNVEIVKGPAPERLLSMSIPQNRSDVKLGQDVSTLPHQTKAALDRAAASGKNIQESLANAVAKIQASLNKTKADNRGVAGPATKTESSAPDYHAIVPINDYPQKARWKATNKEQMVALQDLSGASITNKGIFYPPGTEPGIGQEPKLHLLIESNEEFRVKLAVDELRRILLEASVAALQSADREPTVSGRYKV